MSFHTVKLFFAIGMVLVFGWATAQQYSYTHYDNRDGLAGASVYCSVQDKDGFLWFGTETGLSRFDGTHFKNFTTEDGLPDNEIIRLFVDSKNRVWISPFKNSICYYYKGKIYNQKNDSALKKIVVTDFVRSVQEDKQGNILIQEKSTSHLLRPNGVVEAFHTEGVQKINVLEAGVNGESSFRLVTEGPNNYILLLDMTPNGKVRIARKLKGFPSGNNSYLITSAYDIARKDDSLFFFGSDPTNNYSFPIPDNFIDMGSVNDSLIAINASARCYLFNIHQRKYIGEFLEGYRISSVLEDHEQNLWFTSMGKGIYRLGSSRFKTYQLPRGKTALNVFALLGQDSMLYAGTDHALLWEINTRTNAIRQLRVGQEIEHVRVLSLLSSKTREIIAGTDNGIYQVMLNGGSASVKPFSPTPISVKAALWQGGDLLVAAAQGVFLAKEFPEKLWNERATCVAPHLDGYYIGTLNGLYSVDRKGGKPVFLGTENELLTARISSIRQASDGTFWIATYGEGLIGYKQGKVVANIRTKQGLSSNICRSLYIHGKDLWVGTDKGLNRIRLAGQIGILQLSTADGLNSNVVNAVFVDGDKVYVGTEQGISFFNAGTVHQKTSCLLRVLSVSNGKKQWDFDTTSLHFPHNQNSISFKYVGISYQSAGDIVYRYRLVGLDKEWRSTRETTVSYSALSSGDYVFEVVAINKFGKASGLKSIAFSIEKLLVEKTWFRIILILSGLLLIGAGVLIYTRFIKRKEAEKTLQSKRLAEMEMRSLRAQMNPHFTFNVLNSIQYYLTHNELEAANRYLSRFAKLVRTTLDHAKLSSISLHEEIQTLQIYLELEKMRFGDHLLYQILLDPPHLTTKSVQIPTMLIQPYVENAIKHGLAHKKENAVLHIRFIKKERELVCEIEDNGIGRIRARELAARRNPEHVSAGTELVGERIAAFNKYYHQGLHSQTIDLYDEQGKPRGTRVIVTIPLWIQEA